MSTLCKTFPTAAAARHAVRELRHNGVRAPDVRLLIGHPIGDVHRDPVGGYAAPVAPDGPVGTYAGHPIVRARGTGGFAGNPDQQRQGSFADTDHIMLVTHNNDAEHTRITGLRAARRLLARAALDDDTVVRAVAALHSGKAVVLAEVRERAAADAHAQLNHITRAA